MFYFFTHWLRQETKPFSGGIKWINSMSLPISINNCLLCTKLFSDASNYTCSTASEKSKTSWKNVLDGITPYQISILLVCYFIKQCLCRRLQISNFKNSSEGLLLLMIPWKIFSSNLLTLFLKAIAMHNKKDWEKNIKANANHNINKQNKTKQNKTGQHRKFSVYLLVLFK